MKITEKSDILNETYTTSLKGIFKFELISLFGRLFLAGKPKKVKDATQNLLNLGCGTTHYKGWVNGDFFHLPVKFWKAQSRPTPDWMFDLRYKLNCPNDYWDGIFTEHTLEHLTPAQNFRLLKELHRTMKPNAYIRIIVPDLDKYIQYYNGTFTNDEFSKNFPTGAEAVRNVTQDYFHVSAWNAELMTQFCESAGFKNIKQVQFGVGSDAVLLKDTESRAWSSLYIEAQK